MGPLKDLRTRFGRRSAVAGAVLAAGFGPPAPLSPGTPPPTTPGVAVPYRPEPVAVQATAVPVAVQATAVPWGPQVLTGQCASCHDRPAGLLVESHPPEAGPESA